MNLNKVFKYQSFHLFAYLLCAAVLYLYFKGVSSPRSIVGLNVRQWVLVSWMFAGLFHLWILLSWRLELFYQKMSQWFGKAAFTVHRVGFVALAGGALLPLIAVSSLTSNTAGIDSKIRLVLIVVSTIPILWALYSVAFYFSINRAFGADHFFKEYRSKNLERRGIFKYIANSMYTVVLLLLYHPGLFFNSQAGLLLALLHHGFVWVHYFCTEKPDMKEIYSKA